MSSINGVRTLLPQLDAHAGDGMERDIGRFDARFQRAVVRGGLRKTAIKKTGSERFISAA